MACKCRISCKYTILPLTILIIILFQLYFQYSTFMTKRYQDLENRDKRNQIYTLNFIGKRYDFNLKEIDNYFNDNALMKINILKDIILKGFNKWNESRKNKLDIQIYELFYLIIYDLIFIFFLYKFIFKSVKAGIAKIIIQILKFIFTAIRINKNQDICFWTIIKNHYDNSDLRNSEVFTPEGFEIFEVLCNLVIILDIIWLIIIKKESHKNNYYNLTETELGIKKQVLTDENRVDYKEEGAIELKEEKIYSNENNKESDDDKDDNNNINNKESDDDNDNNNNDNQNDSYNQNEKENDKDDEEINNNKYDEDNENINNNKDEDDDQDNNCESNENNYNNYKNSEVNNSFKDNEEKEDEENNEEEEGIDENQETN